MRALVLLFCLPFSVAATSLPLDPAGDEMIVTAARTPIPRANAVGGVTIIDRATIVARQPQFVTDLLRDVPGFAVSRNGGSGAQTQVRVRGAEGNHLLVLIDGVEANDFSNNDEFDFAHLNADDIERIEIVRGPQSSLWGSDALAGVVNIITRSASRPFELDGATEHGSFGTHSGSIGVGAARDGVNGRLSFSTFDSDGINVSAHGNETDGYRNHTLNLKLGWQLTPALKADLTGRATDARTDFDSVDFTTGLHTDTPAATDIVQGYVGARLHADTFDGHWQHQLVANWTRVDNLTFDPFDTGERRTGGHKYGLDYQSTWRFASDWAVPMAHTFTLAVDYELEKFRQRGPIQFGSDPNQDRQLHTLSYIAEYRVALGQATNLSAGGRWDNNSAFADIGTYRVALSHQIQVTGTTLSFAYATGQKAPTFVERFGFFGGGFPFVGNAQLRPASSRGYELGIQQGLFAERLKLGLNYFNERLLDEIDGFFFDTNSGLFTARNRSGTSSREGVELTVAATLTEQLKVSGSYTYLDAQEHDSLSGQRVDEVRRPNQQGAASVDWSGLDRKLNVNVHLSYTGTRDDLTFLPPLFSGRTTLRPFTLAGITLAYTVNPHLTLTGRVENVFDDKYQEVFDFQTEGLAGYVGLKFNFGH